MNDLLKDLFEGQEFSQEFKDKVSAIFETAIEEKTAQIEEELEQKYTQISEDYAAYVVTEAEEKTEQYIQEEVMPMVEKYLDYSVKEFMTENKLAIESGTKVQLAEQFLTGLTGIAESFNVEVPEGKDDYIAEMEQKVDAMQKRFDKVLDEKTALEQELVESKMASIIDEKIEDLTESQKEKFFKVAAKVKFQDEAQYKASIDELFESYFPVEGGDLLKEDRGQETVTETTQEDKTWAAQLFSKI